jgi:hypothetical protein
MHEMIYEWKNVRLGIQGRGSLPLFVKTVSTALTDVPSSAHTL